MYVMIIDGMLEHLKSADACTSVPTAIGSLLDFPPALLASCTTTRTSDSFFSMTIN